MDWISVAIGLAAGGATGWALARAAGRGRGAPRAGAAPRAVGESLVAADAEPCGVLDRQLRWTRANAPLLEYLGCVEDELLGRRFDEALSVVAPSDLTDAIAAVAAGGRTRFGGDVTLSIGDRATVTRLAVVSLAALGDPAAGCLLRLRDETETQRRLTQLRVTERALHAAASGVVICDARADDLPMVYVNAAFERMTGYGATEVLGRNCRFLNERERDQPGLDEVRAALAEARETTVVLRNHKKDGSAFWNELTISPVVDPSGEVTHFIGVQDDITERMEFGAERERLLAESMADKQSVARAAKARETLLAVVSHELRSPLNAIRLWSSLLQRQEPVDPEMTRRAVAQIDDAVTAQSRIIEDLLDVSRFESGRLDLQREPLDLVDVAREVVRRNQPMAAQRGLAVSCDPEVDRADVLADRGRLEQVLQNLIDNACKFTPRGGSVRVEVSRSRSDEHGDRVRCVVRDTGEGIPADRLQDVFRQFWQADDERRRRRSGLGLGLALVKHVVEHHDGTVRAHSDGPGHGTAIAFELPARAASSARARATPALRDGAEHVEGDLLVVDDDAATVEVLALGLRLRGYDVRITSDAEAARRAIAERRPRVLVSDLSMPEVSGLDLVSGIRRDEFERGVARLPAIAITGRGDPSDRRRVRVAGFDRFLQKPVHMDTLVACVQELLAAEPERGGARILVAAAERSDGERLRAALGERGHEVQVAGSAADALALIAVQAPDVVVASTDLPDGAGAALLDSVRREHDAALTVLLTAGGEEFLPGVDHALAPDAQPDAIAALVSRWLALGR